MAWLAVDKDGSECIYNYKPVRFGINGIFGCDRGYYIQLPQGTIAKLIGREITWEDDPVKLE